MNNLKLSWQQSRAVAMREGDEVRFSSFDVERNRLILSSSSNCIYTTALPKPDELLSKTAVEASAIGLEDDDPIVSFDYLAEREALLIGTSSGNLLLFDGNGGPPEIIGAIHGGVRCISTSPDGGATAIVSGLCKLLLMTTEWDVLYETPLDEHPHDADVSEDDQSSSSTPNKKNPNSRNFDCSVSWRGDGKYFCLLIGDSNNNNKRLKIFDRENPSPTAISEARNLVGTALGWQPTGAKIAAVEPPSTIRFFERNGLERSFFNVGSEIRSVKWNCNSDLIGAVCRDENEEDCLKIFFSCNNHWYLKQEIRYLGDEAMEFAWNPTNPLQCICWTRKGTIRITVYNFVWMTSVSYGSTALVIDGPRVLITPLSLTLMPPPMFTFSVKFSGAVRDVAFYSDESSRRVAALLSTGYFAVFDLPAFGAEFDGEEFMVETETKTNQFGCRSSLSQFTWLDATSVLSVGENVLQEITVKTGRISRQIPVVDGPVISLASHPFRKNTAFVQLYGGRTFEYSAGILDRRSDADFRSSCPWMSVVFQSEKDRAAFIFGLDYRRRLQVTGKTICDDCRSFSFYSISADQVVSHLIVLTGNDLFAIEMSEALTDGLEKKRSTPVWERGATVIGVIHGDEAAVVIQTNRGNLECIYPRNLILNIIHRALEDRRWSDAFFKIRRHRFDFQIVVEWRNFADHASEFVLQIKNFRYVTEFVSSLKEKGELVSSVIAAIRKAVEEHVEESREREICILTTLAKSDPPAIEEALIRIKTVREKELLRDGAAPSTGEAEEDLKHLLWLCDGEAVYEAALGLYDLKLAAMVAIHSQKDPKEFLPFLQELEKKSMFLMKYEIDLKLKRFESALRNLVSGGDDYSRECKRLIDDNPDLFPLGLELFKNSALEKEILEAWGDHLNAEKFFEDAASIYISCRSMKKALKSYRGCYDWRGALTVAGILNYSKAEIIGLAHELCDELQALGNPREASVIALNYLSEVGVAVGLLITARDWMEALRLGFGEEGRLVSQVKTSCLECSSILVDEYQTGLEKIGKYTARYLAVRQRRLSLAAAVGQPDSNLAAAVEDTASETSSNLSGLSIYNTSETAISSVAFSGCSKGSGTKGRRQRNKGRIRAGGRGEEMVLAEHLKSMTLTTEARTEIKSLTTALVMLGEDGTARKVQRSAERFQVSQIAAVRLVNDATSTESVNESEYTLERYTETVGTELGRFTNDPVFAWRLKALTA